MAAMDAESIDAIVTDPPYGLEFMGKEWDRPALAPKSPTKALMCCTRSATARDFVSATCSSAKSMQDWHEAWAREAFRIANGGTRSRSVAPAPSTAWDRPSRMQAGRSGHPRMGHTPTGFPEVAQPRRREVEGLGHRPQSREGADRHGPQAVAGRVTTSWRTARGRSTSTGGGWGRGDAGVRSLGGNRRS